MLRKSFSKSMQFATALSCFLSIVSTGSVAAASEIKLLSAVALRPGIEGLIAGFGKTTGNNVMVDYATVGALTDRIQKGEPVDVAIVSGPQIDDLQGQGKIVAGSRVDIAKVGVGVFIRKGAPRPDISSADAFKRSMLAAKAIAYPDPAGGGASGIYMAALIDRLGIAVDMKPKTKLFPPAPPLYQSVAGGEVDIGFNQISEILAQPSVELLGPLPAAIQNYTLFAAGIGAGSKEALAAKALVSYLSSPAAQEVLKSKGFETR
jgi:molybdate transport system substrate-binding protein